MLSLVTCTFFLVLYYYYYYYYYVVVVVVVVSCHMHFLPGTPLEPMAIPTAQASSFRLQQFPHMCDLSIFCCLYVVNLLHIFLVWISNISLSPLSLFRCPNYYYYYPTKLPPEFCQFIQRTLSKLSI
jgi:hypothetical protein